MIFIPVYPEDIGGGSLGHIALEVAAVDDAMDLYKRAREMGARAIQPRISDGWWRTLIFDPDGHKLEILTKAVGLAEGAAG